MIVAVDERLDNIKEGLKRRGYFVVGLEENKPVDAIVYYKDSRNSHEMFQGDYFSGLRMGSSERGVFMVNANHKTIDEIDQMLKRRSYSPLFTSLE